MHINKLDHGEWYDLLGKSIIVMMNSERKSNSIAAVSAFVFPFIKLRQIEIFFTNNELPAGFITWGYLDNEAIDKMSAGTSFLLSIEELNCGDNLVIFDIMSNLRDIRPIIYKVRSLSKNSKDGFYGVRRNNIGDNGQLKYFSRSYIRLPFVKSS